MSVVQQISSVGGRHSVSGLIATVYGATGFAGRYVVNALGQIGSQIVVPYRGEELGWRHLKVMGDLGQIVPVPFTIRDTESVERAVSRSNVAINLVGAFWKTKNYTILEANADSAYAIAKAAKKNGIERFIHISSVSASPTALSEFGRAKHASELAVREVFPEATIIRSATLFGVEDRMLNRYSSFVQRWPWIPVLKNGGLEQPLFAGDLAKAVLKVATDQHNSFAGQTLDVAGPEQLPETEICEWLINEMTSTKKRQNISSANLLRIAKVLDNLRNPRLTSDEVLYILQNNTTENNAAEKLGFKPLSFKLGAINLIRAYRKAEIIDYRA